MGMIARGRKKIFGERITLPLATDMLGRIDACLETGEARLSFLRDAIEKELRRREASTDVHYVRATLSKPFNGKTFYKLELRDRSSALFEESGYHDRCRGAVHAILYRAMEFGVDVVVVTGWIPVLRGLEEAPFEAARTYVKVDGEFSPLVEHPVGKEELDSVEYGLKAVESSREKKVPNAATLAAMEEARRIRAGRAEI
jgi:hypothetical protein